ncbi:MAG: hypothetical protein JKY66_07045 [Spongiibacteraceae bacterium]|nr:hypothetical protein [Spongiibacteraceae bacterium]
MSELLSVDNLAWLALFSVIAFFATIIIVPWLIIQLPADYFINEKRKKFAWAKQFILLRYLLLIIKNMLGYVIVIAGIIMLLLPGQGILSIVVGLMLIDFPRKFQFERWLVQRAPVLRVIHKLRKVANKDPFVFYNK